MTEQRVALVAMRRPELPAGRRDGAPSLVEFAEGTRVGSVEVDAILAAGGGIEVASFSEVVSVAAVFYGEGDASRAIVVKVSPLGEVAWFHVPDEWVAPNGVREKGRVRHPLVASFLGTLRIMWFAVRHPGKSAWIDHDTGDVWVADRTM